jgi:ABC-type branched-subunit amino acid transport system ATPase component
VSEAGRGSGEPILRVEALAKSFGGLRAVNDLSFEVKPGTITSLIGGNGAGKTTAFNLITGYLAPDAGAIHFRGRRVDGLAPHQVARAGIARGFQELRLFNRLSARDNLETAVPHQQGEGLLRALLGGPKLKAERAATAARASALLDELTLAGQAEALAERLSYGQQKLVALGRLIAAHGELLLLDEPTSGLSPAMAEGFCARARTLAQAGKTILLIEHNVEIVMRLSDWIVVMHQGGKIAEGPPSTVRADTAVMHAYLGLS